MKFTPGGLVGALSGSAGAITASRNRYGYYFRARTIPTNRDTEYQQIARQYLGELSSAWAGLDDAQRLTWRHWAENNPSVDALGRQMILAPNVAYIQTNNRLKWDNRAILTEAPIGTAPAGLSSLSLVATETASDCIIDFTPTPIGAQETLMVWATVVDSAGITYTEGMKRLIHIAQKASTSGSNQGAYLEARFGNLVEGQVIHMSCQVLDTTTGLVSAKFSCKGVVAA